jgi:hypothetical protein
MKVTALIDSSSAAHSWTQIQQEVPVPYFRQRNPSMLEVLPYFRLQLVFSIKAVSHETWALYLSMKILSHMLEDLSLSVCVTAVESYSSPADFMSEFKESF